MNASCLVIFVDLKQRVIGRKALDLVSKDISSNSVSMVEVSASYVTTLSISPPLPIKKGTLLLIERK